MNPELRAYSPIDKPKIMSSRTFSSKETKNARVSASALLRREAFGVRSGVDASPNKKVKKTTDTRVESREKENQFISSSPKPVSKSRLGGCSFDSPLFRAYILKSFFPVLINSI